MKPYKIELIDEKAQWNSLLANFSNYHFLQSWQWGEIKKLNGWNVNRYAIKSKDEYIAAFSLLTKRLHPRIPITVAYTPRGPGFDINSVDLQRLLLTIEHVARNRGCAYVKVDPDIDETTEEGVEWKKALIKSGWQYSPQQVQPKNTGTTALLPDDSDGEEKILASMKKTWRYNIRNSTKRGVTIRVGNSKDIAKFYKLYKLTGERQKFGIRSLEYYREVYRAFNGSKCSDSLIMLSEHPDEDEPLSAAVFIRLYDKVWYFYAASSDKRRSDMPNYPLQWEAMKWARATGAKLYDWGGASSNPDDPNDPMARVWHFKKGFGAQFFSGTGAWDKPIKTPQWLLTILLSKVGKLFKR